MSHGWLIFSVSGIRLFTLTTLLFIASGCAKNSITRWAQLPVPIYADSSVISTPEAQSDLMDAMSFWEQRAGKKLFDYKGVWTYSFQPFSGTASNPGAILANVIFFQNPWPATQNVIGQTVVSSYENEIQSAMIMLNPDAHFCHGDCWDQYFSNSARKNLAHELGHFLGFGHHADPENVMYPVLQPGGTLNGVGVDETLLRELVVE
jgi:hypothetical protein